MILVLMPPKADTAAPPGQPSAAPAPSAAVEDPTTLLGKPAPAWKSAGWVNAARAGLSRTLAGLKGKVVLLDFWGISCGPCVAILPDVQRVHEQFKEKGVVVVGVHDSGTTPEQLAAFARTTGITYAQIIDQAATPSEGLWFGRTFRAYGVHGIPTVAVIDRKGRVAFLGDLDAAVGKIGTLIADRR